MDVKPQLHTECGAVQRVHRGPIVLSADSGDLRPLSAPLRLNLYPDTAVRLLLPCAVLRCFSACYSDHSDRGEVATRHIQVFAKQTSCAIALRVGRIDHRGTLAHAPPPCDNYTSYAYDLR
ncbi:hypothetical protein EVAR_98973_1 [Eumeta japonica]|uniref:Uncharacterized protein n=1 Tax=Eumeta variegata TaxID=151549 RepID=A0A4C1YQT3_EUMVA|nr:hypothetical protein EVAR_98973_1 [Eumeta japonica]